MSPVPETLAQGEAGGDGQSDGALLQGEGQQGGEQEDPDQLELELRPRPQVRVGQSTSQTERCCQDAFLAYRCVFIALRSLRLRLGPGLADSITS